LPEVAHSRKSLLGSRESQELCAIPFAGDNESWVRALCERQPGAIAAFYHCYAERVLRVLVRILGSDQDLKDVHHETFLRALNSIGNLRDANCLTQWVTSVAVFSARTCLQGRYRRRWLRLFAPDDLAELAGEGRTPDPTLREALRATYKLLDLLPPVERIVFSLRFIEGMELTEVAAACDISLATTKRRLSRAQQRFSKLASRHPVLSEWLKDRGQWNSNC
jgi:RNA polymerase sigma-70 factor (ECF subfamily)